MTQVHVVLVALIEAHHVAALLHSIVVVVLAADHASPPFDDVVESLGFDTQPHGDSVEICQLSREHVASIDRTDARHGFEHAARLSAH